jgi:hypothetical protein
MCICIYNKVFFLHIFFGFCCRNGKFSLLRFFIMGISVISVMILPFLPLLIDHYLALKSEAADASSGPNSSSLSSSISNRGELNVDLLKQAALEQLTQIGKRLFPFVASHESTAENTSSWTNECGIMNDDLLLYSHGASHDIPGDCTAMTTINSDSNSNSNSISDSVLSNAEHQRGLLHSYWAPNFWALYVFTDRVLGLMVKLAAKLLNMNSGGSSGGGGGSLSKLQSKLGFLLSQYLPMNVKSLILDKSILIQAVKSPSVGLVDEIQFALLPHITPLVTLVLTLLSIIPSLYLAYTSSSSSSSSSSDLKVILNSEEGVRNKKMAKENKSEEEEGAMSETSGFGDSGNMKFVRSVAHVALSSFVFGWHVHEKVWI